MCPVCILHAVRSLEGKKGSCIESFGIRTLLMLLGIFAFICMWCACSQVWTHIWGSIRVCVCLCETLRLSLGWPWVVSLLVTGRVRSLSETQGSPTSRVLDNLLWWSPFSAFQTLELQEGCHAHQAFRWVLGTAKSSLTELSGQLRLLWFLAHLH